MRPLRSDVLDGMTAVELDAIESNVPTVFAKKFCDRNGLAISYYHIWATELFHQLRVELGFEEGSAP